MIELYQAGSCPYCERVRAKFTEVGVSSIAHNPRTANGDVRNTQTHTELLEIGGKGQIPFIVDTNREETLYESNDTCTYLERHYGRAKVTQ